MQLVFAESARRDLLEAWIYIADENLAAADSVLEKIEQDAQTLLLQTLIGRARPELGIGVRSWPTATPYILFYVADPETVTVVRVLHHARDIQSALF
jgi:addiction module RelE/StbE family toxin